MLDPNTQYNRALEAIKNGNAPIAYDILSKLLRDSPKHPGANFHLGQLLLKLAKYDLAINYLSNACKLLPHHVEPLLQLAVAFEQVNSIGDVTTTLEYAERQFKRNQNVQYSLAQHYIKIGKLVEANRLLATIRSRDYSLLSAYAWLDSVRYDKKQRSNESLAQLVTFKQALSGDDENYQSICMTLAFARGIIYDHLDDTANARECFALGNALQRQQCEFNTQAMDTFFAQLKNVYSANVLRSISNLPQQKAHTQADAQVPIFIVGLPRSGSTLLEQMLCKHPLIDSVGEQSYISDQIVPFISAKTQQAYPECTELMTREMLIEARKLYWRAVAVRQVNAQYVINKLPANFQSIGLIYQLFPNAVVIHLKRHLADCALSIWQSHFAMNEPYLCDISELSHYITLYQDCMAHWNSVLNERILEVNYENLVTQAYDTIRDVLSACRLDMHGDCLSPESSTRAVDTLSAAQVRMPIHAKSIGRAKRYPELLAQFSEQ